MKNVIYLAITIWFLSLSAIAQKSNNLKLDPEVWKESKKELVYDGIMEKKEKPETPIKPISSNKSWNFSGMQPVFFGIIIIVVIIAILLIIKKSRQPVTIKQHRFEANSIAEAEENLPDVKLDKIYQEALEKGEFNAALRIKFLMILQSMIDAGMIIWKKRKTNEQYLTELTQIELKNSFQHIVKLYDSVWYGSVSLTEDQYHQVIQRITSLNGQLHGQE